MSSWKPESTKPRWTRKINLHFMRSSHTSLQSRYNFVYCLKSRKLLAPITLYHINQQYELVRFSGPSLISFLSSASAHYVANCVFSFEHNCNIPVDLWFMKMFKRIDLITYVTKVHLLSFCHTSVQNSMVKRA